jgi:hypothetical protein
MKKIFFITALLMLFCASDALAQTRKKSAPSPGINGTFRLHHPQKFKKFYNEVKIASLGKGKLRVGLDVVYPRLDSSGQPTIADKRQIEGVATLKGNTAIFTIDENDSCSIMIKFIGDGMIAVLQESEPTDCGLRRIDVATGNYRKISGTRPKFKEDLATRIGESSAP